MTHMTPKQIKRYIKTREQGFIRFVLVSGVLSWGVPMAAVHLLANAFFDNLNYNWKIMLPTWLISGAIFGALMWAVQRKIYNLQMAKQDELPPQ